MRRSAILACCGVFLAAAPSFAQSNWYHEGYQGAYPQQAEELVRVWYQRFLHREPDPNRAAWVDALNSGQQPEAVLAGILSSTEYYDKAGGSPEAFVNRLFQDLTGRRPSPSEMDHWVRRAAYGDRKDVAYALLMRYPQDWGTGPTYRDDRRYDYRRPNWPYRR
jgi:hypothetical protein